jgi:hypothetical protein
MTEKKTDPVTETLKALGMKPKDVEAAAYTILREVKAWPKGTPLPMSMPPLMQVVNAFVDELVQSPQEVERFRAAALATPTAEVTLRALMEDNMGFLRSQRKARLLASIPEGPGIPLTTQAYRDISKGITLGAGSTIKIMMLGLMHQHIRVSAGLEPKGAEIYPRKPLATKSAAFSETAAPARLKGAGKKPVSKTAATPRRNNPGQDGGPQDPSSMH